MTKQYIQENLIRKDGRLNSRNKEVIKETPVKLFLIFNNLKETPRCKCGCTPAFLSFKKGYREYCSTKCSTNAHNTKEKSKSTNLKNCGFEYPMQSKEAQEKSKETNMEKLGVEHPLQSKEVQEKSKSTNLKNCGFEYPMQSKEAQEKSKETNMEKLGVDNPFKSETIKDKIKVTHLKNCGFENPSQAGLYLNGYKHKDYIYPSGKIVKIQGYENLLLDELLEVYTESEILTDRKDMPEFWYFNDGKKHRYFPDAYIPKDNLIYEVKSSWTLKCSMKNNIFKLKKQSVIDSNFNFKLKIY